MRRKRIIALLALVGIVAVVLAAPWRTSAHGWPCWKPRRCIAGAWILSWPVPPGVEPLMITETLTPLDSSGNKLVYWARGVNPMFALAPLFPESDFGGDAVGTFVKSGWNTYDFTMITHLGKSLGLDARGVVQYFWVYSGTAECTDANTMVKDGTLAFFSAMDVPAFGLHNQDVNKDGFPDKGEEPFLCMPVTWESKRVKVTAPFEPTPM
jgi:hypothetical protein